MTGKRITGKFSDEEYQIIHQIQEKLNLNDNQLSRQGIILLVNMLLVQDFLGNSNYLKMLKPLAEEMNSYLNSQKFQKKLEKLSKNLNQKDIAEIEEKAKEIERETKILTKKKKLGRPKKKKIVKKPGRPKI